MKKVDTSMDQHRNETVDYLTTRLQSIEGSVMSRSNLSESTDEETIVLAKRLEKALDDFCKYTIANTIIMKAFERNQNSHRNDTANLLN